MALFQSKQVASRMPIIAIDGASCLTPIQAEFVVPTGGLAVNDVVEMGGITPAMRVVDAIIHNTAAGASATFDFGYLSGSYGVTTGAARTCGNEFIAAGDMNATTVKRLAKSVTAEPTAAVGNLSDDAVGWGFKVTGATWAAGTRIRATLYVASI
ncbi:MAG TPA: hypothetical protein VGE36_13735 [Roseateles sp.]